MGYKYNKDYFNLVVDPYLTGIAVFVNTPNFKELQQYLAVANMEFFI